MRGEHHPAKTLNISPRGSSPLARGALGVEGAVLRGTGIIPACAGSTPGGTWTCAVSQDHPRLRGEHLSQTQVTTSSEGSSPLARGAHAHRAAQRHHGGIIPACAGSTPPSRGRSRRRRDHPRLRGEHLFQPPLLVYCEGSSPLARGAPHLCRALDVDDGIIPACAGSTKPSSRSR